MILMRILIYGAGVIGEKSMKNEEYKKLSIKEFTKAAGRYESNHAGIYEMCMQVIKRILPPMGNEIITLVKDTSLANTIANKEIIMMAKEYSAKGLIWPLFSTAIFFLVFVGALTLLFGWLEKKLDYFRC